MKNPEPIETAHRMKIRLVDQAPLAALKDL
jgi:hypothetical protein